MRIGYGVLVLSFTGLCGAVALPPQEQQPTAEQEFKNIVSFKGQKAGDVIPAMQFMCASLKVDCDYCHTQDRASDEKGAKRTARVMIAMQRDINEKNFRGRNQVTCATCHAGHTHPINLSPAEGIEVRPRRSQTIKADDVLAAYAKAVGGGVSPMAALDLKGTSQTGDTKGSLHETYSAGKFAFEASTPKGPQRRGFNGNVGWFSTERGIQSAPLLYVADFVNQHILFMGPATLPKLDGRSTGTAKIGNNDEQTISGALADKTRVTLFFNTKNGLLDRTMFAYPSILGSIAQVNDYADYRKINGVMLPTKVINHAAEGDTTVTFRSIKVVAELPATAFDPPKS